jgi:hypothetical protein
MCSVDVLLKVMLTVISNHKVNNNNIIIIIYVGLEVQ